MMKDVVISLHSTQNTGTDEEDTIDFSTDGMYTYDGENACITYLESEVTGLTGTRTSVIVTPDKVAVERDGFITSRMFFMEGEKTSFLYDTPAGSATLSVRARSIKKDFNEDKIMPPLKSFIYSFILRLYDDFIIVGFIDFN